MVLLGDKAQVEAHFGPFGDSANPEARLVHALRQTYHRLRNSFGCTRRYSDVMWVKWILISVHFEIVLISTQDRCTICVERAIVSEVMLGAPDGNS